MTTLDWMIVAFAVLLALFGYRHGFIVGALSFGGFAAGVFLGTRLGSLLLPRGSASPYAPAFGLVGALVAGTVLATGLEGLGVRLRRLLIFPGVSMFDGILGALLSVAVALGIVWIAAAVIGQIPGQSQLRTDIQRSRILRELNHLLPPSGPILGALSRLDPLPKISGPSPDVVAPLPHDIDTPGVRTAEHSVVRVLGTACGLAIEGSGWVLAPNEILTNAHVVAGEHDTTVQIAGQGRSLPAQVIVFDPTDDIAVLQTPELSLPPLRMVSEPASGSPGAIIGYPENGPLDAQAARIGTTQQVITQNAYGEGPVTRLLTPLRGLVRPGNSGGPLVNRSGAVLTTIFAGTTGAGVRGGYGVANATVRRVLRDRTLSSSSGRCA